MGFWKLANLRKPFLSIRVVPCWNFEAFQENWSYHVLFLLWASSWFEKPGSSRKGFLTKFPTLINDQVFKAKDPIQFRTPYIEKIVICFQRANSILPQFCDEIYFSRLSRGNLSDSPVLLKVHFACQRQTKMRSKRGGQNFYPSKKRARDLSKQVKAEEICARKKIL